MFVYLCSHELLLLPCVLFSRMKVCSVEVTQRPQELHVVKAERAPVQQALQLQRCGVDESVLHRGIDVLTQDDACVSPPCSLTPRFLIVSHVKSKGNVDLLF